MFKVLISFIAFLVLRFKGLFKKVQSNRFDTYTPFGDLTDPRTTGLLANKSSWSLDTPQLDRAEEDFFVASNTFDKSFLILRFKWRPSSTITTLASYLSIELDGKNYKFEDVSTYKPKQSCVHPPYITQFGSEGAPLRLFIINPQRHYRILFRGYMRATDEANNEHQVFVKLNLQVFLTSKVHDFQTDYSQSFMARQAADAGTICPPVGAILHNRFENSIKMIGECNLTGGDVHPIHLWGFHARQFVGPAGERPEFKRMLGHLDNGRIFHLASINHRKHLYTCGYTCFSIGPSVAPVTHVSSSWLVDLAKSRFSMSIAGQGIELDMVASRRDCPGFWRLDIDGNERGWAFVTTEEPIDSNQELATFRASLDEYKRATTSGDLVDINLIESTKYEATPLVVNLDQSDCQRSSLVGAKAASLAQLRARVRRLKGVLFEVPPAIVLTRYAYQDLQLENPTLKDEAKQLDARVGRGNLDSLGADCDRLEKLFQREANVTSRLREEIMQHLKSYFNIMNLNDLDGRSFAVRSSSWGEDEDDMSAAGQLTTVLNVTGFEHLLTAIKQCFASKFNKTNIEYKRQRGMPLDLPMAVVIQEMVACDKAGVMFTCNPTDGDTSIYMITANYGLGESVVSGQTDPDTVVVRKDNNNNNNFKIDDIKVGMKKVIIDANGQVDTSKCCLSADEILELARCGHDVSSYFRCERDIEWGFKGSKLYLFQSRPVTGLDAYTELELIHECEMPSRAEKEFATRANVGEVMPYADSPLNATFCVRLWAIFMNRKFSTLGTLDPRGYLLEASPDILYSAYQAFFTLRGKALFDFSRRGPKGTERSVISRAMEVGIFGHEVDDEEIIEAATDISRGTSIRFQELRFFICTWCEQIFTKGRLQKATDTVARLKRDINALRFAKGKNLGSPAEGLLKQCHTMVKYCSLPFVNHITITMLSGKVNFELLNMLSKYIKSPSKLYAEFSRILATCPDVLSAEIPRSIAKMASLINERGRDQTEAFAKMTPMEGLKYISSDLKSELAIQFNDFMVTFGHRCYDEFEVSKPTWHDEPERVIEMLQTNVRRYLKDDNSEADAPTTKSNNLDVDRVIDSLGIKLSSFDRLMLKYSIIPRCLKYLSARERTKNCTIALVDAERQALRLLARELRQTNRIPDDDLLYYFFLHELEGLVREPQPGLVTQAARRRRMFRKHLSVSWRYDEIVRGHKIVPLHLKKVHELDESITNAPKLIGTTASKGKVQAKVSLVNSYEELGKVRAGDILLAYSTDIAFSPVFPLVSGVITEVGGLISHGAVVAREYGLPSVIGIPNVTKILEDGEEVLLDADNGIIVRLGKVQ